MPPANLKRNRKKQKRRGPSGIAAFFFAREEYHMSSESQIRANQANAQLSTGPKTEAGKARSSKNAVKTGLTGRAVLLAADDLAAYEKHLQNFSDRYQPANDTERELLQSIADTHWRLQRIPNLEAGIYALGRKTGPVGDRFPPWLYY